MEIRKSHLKCEYCGSYNTKIIRDTAQEGDFKLDVVACANCNTLMPYGELYYD